MNPVAIILAAGKGTRMKSETAKVLHRVAGRPMIEHVIAAVRQAGVAKIVIVVGHQGEEVCRYLGDEYTYVWQREQLGTGHAVMQTEKELMGSSGPVLILCGDTPLLRGETLRELLTVHQREGNDLTLLTAWLDDPTGYGRIVRREGQVEAIIEEKDADAETKKIKEINAGVYCFDREKLFAALKEISPANAQGEYYLTDTLQIFARRGWKRGAVQVADPVEITGVNDRVQLARVGAILRERINTELMLSGVTIIDPATTYIEAGVKVGRDTIIYPQTYLEAGTEIGERCVIGPFTRIAQSVVGNDCTILASFVVESKIGNGVNVGPYAYLRPGTEVADGVRIGDFVEIKKSRIGTGSKVPHLSYIGDTTIGVGVNIGAGTITCNYDGVNKWPTIIGDGAFIGSNTNLVAPVEVGEGAVVAAGSTITKKVPPGALAVARERQYNIANWALRRKTKKEKEE
ncbi:MAG: bifunctional UDP-N-acetylglucosamine pyrophosphorylase / glucosamine-phosphate N-acetyltransferase [Eubacteriales bacterium]|nr:bifunctional UDP-N-acetylglucosamine pyrophosphorylase / glucosamine-phosphate N-acetyltransferase [Eubacteriales bacterium]MDN5363425.1 bifunctional UDP-N-acetylglucosamine pyrophosphorylase / glucosamine-phosphate N-acetyltransferase [Eubacteriales bacterium]